MTWMVIGLGNPGPSYAGHRHNVGAMVVAELARRAGEGFTAARGMRAETVETRITASGVGVVAAGSQKLILVRSRTYMNESGIPVGKLAAFHQVIPHHIIAVHDELDIDFGTLRLKLGGGDNGHNGLRSIRSHLGTGDFHRVRVGISRPPGRQDAADYVLSNFAKSEHAEVALTVDRAADAVEALIVDGLAATQNTFHSA